MADINISASKWRLIEVGRVVLFTNGPNSGRLAVIVQIIDSKRVLIDGPSQKFGEVVRQSAPLNHILITHIVISKLPRAAGRGPVAKQWEEAKVDEQWEQSGWAKRRDQQDKRKALSDFERFKVMRLKKQTRFEVRKAHAKVREAAKA